MSFQIDLRRKFIPFIPGCLLYKFQDPRHIPVQHLLVQQVVFHPVQYLVIEIRSHRIIDKKTGHDQIRSGTHLRHAVVRITPVRHHQSAIAPLIPQHCLQQLLVLRGIISVHLVVSCHHAPGIGLFHGNFKSPQVDLPQSPLTDNGIHQAPVCLLIVDGKMFQRSTYPLRLYATDHGNRHLARQIRVFRIILKIASAQRVALDIDGGGQQHIRPVFQHFISHRRPDLLIQLRIPRSRQSRCRRKCRTMIGACVAFPFERYPQTCRSVIQNCRRNTQAVTLVSGSHSQKIMLRPIIVFIADHHKHLFFQCHGFHYLHHRVRLQRLSGIRYFPGNRSGLCQHRQTRNQEYGQNFHRQLHALAHLKNIFSSIRSNSGASPSQRPRISPVGDTRILVGKACMLYTFTISLSAVFKIWVNAPI